MKLILPVLYVSLMVSANHRLTVDEMKSTRGVYCGSKLADRLALLCGGMYNSRIKRIVRSGYDGINYDGYVNNKQMLDSKSIMFPFLSKETAYFLLSTGYRKRNPSDPIERSYGVADECCRKPCNLWELSAYCGNRH